MRLTNVLRGDRLSAKGLYGLIRAVLRIPRARRRADARYRRHLFGAPHSAHTQVVMRGPSEWSIGERELFAAFVSRLNQCQF